jgi:hypothetical protein
MRVWWHLKPLCCTNAIAPVVQPGSECGLAEPEMRVQIPTGASFSTAYCKLSTFDYLSEGFEHAGFKSRRGRILITSSPPNMVMQKREPLLKRIFKGLKPAKHKPLPSEKPKLTEKRQDQLNYNIRRQAYYGNNAQIARLIKKGADIAAPSEFGQTTLHRAAGNGRIQPCAFLLEEYAKAGGDVKAFISAKDSWDKTAIRMASEKGHTETAQFLATRLFREMFGIETAAAFLKSFNECTA